METLCQSTKLLKLRLRFLYGLKQDFGYETRLILLREWDQTAGILSSKRSPCNNALYMDHLLAGVNKLSAVAQCHFEKLLESDIVLV